jgi:hypothetical protein
MPEAIALAAAGRLRVGELVTHRFAVQEFAEAWPENSRSDCHSSGAAAGRPGRCRVFTERVDGALNVIVRP